MSTRSYIVKQISDEKCVGIYCHNDGYIDYLGKLLYENYNNSKSVDEILALGDISFLTDKLYPDPSKPHGFEFDERQDGVTVAYGRDRGEEDTGAKEYTLEEVEDLISYVDYIYLFSKDDKWLVLSLGEEELGFQNLADKVNCIYDEIYDVMEMD